MRFGTLTISALISTLPGFAQPDLSLVRFKDGQVTLNSDSNDHIWKIYTVNDGPLFLYQLVSKSSGRTELKLIRETDSTYYFVRYFPSGREKLEGYLSLKLNLYYTPFIPDFIKDPDGSKGIGKDTLVSIFHSSSIEYGWENDSTGNISAGFYSQGYKIGIWDFGFLLKNRFNEGSYFVRTKANRFYVGFSFPDSVKKLNTITWPDISGTWVANEEYSTDSLILYHRGSSQDSDFSIEFKSEKKYYLRNPYIHGAPKGLHEWWTIGDRLFLKVGKSTHEYKIISFTGPELVIQLITVRDVNNEFL